MYVKRLQNSEILDGMHLVWEVFAEEIAPTYTPQGVETFRQFIKMDNFMPKMEERGIVMFGAVEGTELCGITAVQNDGHILLLFVRKSWQKRGVAKMLTEAVYQHCTTRLSLTRLTVRAFPGAVEVYRHMGFREIAPEQDEDGIRFVPMERMVSLEDIKPQKTKTSNKGLIIGVVVIVVVLFVLLGLLFVKVFTNLREGMGNQNSGQLIQEEPFEDFFNGEFGNEFNEEPEAESSEGIEGVECYVEENLPYTIVEETYTYQSDGSNGEYPMEFDVKYPQIEGLDSEKAEEINEMLKECAMTSVDTMYLNPSESMKEGMLQEEEPFMASLVTYKVTYAGADFISVAFSDEYYVGNFYAGYVDLRTRNIRLSDGKRFETADIIELNDEFMQEWKSRMKKEAPDSVVLDALKMSQLYQILGGEILENRYYDNFFVDAEGVQIGMTYHYLSEDQSVNERGWITAPFDMDEIKEYKTDSDFWAQFDSAQN